MRLTGPRRGNPTVRFMIEQSARRRMASGLLLERGTAVENQGEGGGGDAVLANALPEREWDAPRAWDGELA